MSDSPPPKVSVSYSYDSESHETWVYEFARRLRAGGIDATLDKWHLRYGDDKNRFMESLIDHERVLVICSAGYVAKAEEQKGGAGYEAGLITNEIVNDQGTKKFIPVIRDNPEKRRTKALSGLWYADFSEDANFESALASLLKVLHGQSIAPPIGPIPTTHESLYGPGRELRVKPGANPESMIRFLHDGLHFSTGRLNLLTRVLAWLPREAAEMSIEDLSAHVSRVLQMDEYRRENHHVFVLMNDRLNVPQSHGRGFLEVPIALVNKDYSLTPAGFEALRTMAKCYEWIEQ